MQDLRFLEATRYKISLISQASVIDSDEKEDKDGTDCTYLVNARLKHTG